MNETVYMLQHEGKLLFTYGAFKTRESAEAAAKDPGVLDSCKPATVVKYFGDPGEYERRLAEFKPPTVVKFVQNGHKA